MNCNNIPVYIISFNRLSYLKMQIERFEQMGLTNINIVDNASTYPPLLAYLRKSPHKVYHMDDNYGHLVVFVHPAFKHVRENEYYAVTDPDIIPIEECPDNFMEVFYNGLAFQPQVYKVGFSLKMDDLPPYSLCSQDYIEKYKLDEKSHFLEYKGIRYFKKGLDTTFALYRPSHGTPPSDFFDALQTTQPYVARHIPWYRDMSLPNEEDLFYDNTDSCFSSLSGKTENKEKVGKFYENLLKIR